MSKTCRIKIQAAAFSNTTFFNKCPSNKKNTDHIMLRSPFNANGVKFNLKKIIISNFQTSLKPYLKK